MALKEILSGPDNQAIYAYADLFDPGDWYIEDRTGGRRFYGRLIGTGSSQREEHNHPHEAFSDRGRCAACRWSEIYIFEVLLPSEGERLRGKYCVYTLGPSVIPGEVTRANVRWASSGFEVVELATVRRGERGAPFLPAAHAKALAMAANVDEDIADAYVNRAVA